MPQADANAGIGPLAYPHPLGGNAFLTGANFETGQGGVGVHGPEDLSFNGMASIMTEVLRKPVRFQEVPGPAYKASLMQHGASEPFAQSLVDMFAEVGQGIMPYRCEEQERAAVESDFEKLRRGGPPADSWMGNSVGRQASGAGGHLLEGDHVRSAQRRRL